MAMTTAEADKILSVGFALRALTPGLFAELVDEHRRFDVLPGQVRRHGRAGTSGTGAGGGHGHRRREHRVGRPQGPEKRKTARRPTSFRCAVTDSDVLNRAVRPKPDPRKPFTNLCTSYALPDRTSVDRHGPWSTDDVPFRSAGRIPASENLHIECPSRSPEAGVLHNCPAPATPLGRECRIRRETTGRSSEQNRPWCEEVADKPWARLHRFTLP
ncbi:hypothetical protein ACIA6D_02870 [Streptomyces cacaoi]|uniref:hypothetical protein n=1 Tax=Streptomyces cacaoi TaxID=1898 RepID=UPI0037485EC2